MNLHFFSFFLSFFYTSILWVCVRVWLCERFGLRYWKSLRRERQKKVACNSTGFILFYVPTNCHFAGIDLTPLSHTPSPTNCTLVDLKRMERCNHCGFVLQHPLLLDDWNCPCIAHTCLIHLDLFEWKGAKALIGNRFPSFLKTTAGLSHGVIVWTEQNTLNRTTVISLPGVSTALSCIMFTMLRWAKVLFLSIKLKLIDVISIIAFLFFKLTYFVDFSISSMFFFGLFRECPGVFHWDWYREIQCKKML